MCSSYYIQLCMKTFPKRTIMLPITCRMRCLNKMLPTRFSFWNALLVFVSWQSGGGRLGRFVAGESGGEKKSRRTTTFIVGGPNA